MTLESLTVPELAALCGLEQNHLGGWFVGGASDRSSQRFVARSMMVPGKWVARSMMVPGKWAAWPDGACEPHVIIADTEHAALVALARHLNVKPPEIPVKYKRIDRDPKTDDYVDYTPKAGDRWHFGRGEPWTVGDNGRQVGPPMEPCAHGATCFILGHTTHIERPVKVRDVRGPDYAPQVGDVLCGPDGAAMTVKMVFNDGSMTIVDRVGSHLAVGRFYLLSLIDLCTRIEREE